MDIFEGRIEAAILPSSDTFGMAFVAVWATDRQAVEDLLFAVTESQKNRKMEMSGFEITMPCGYSQRFTNNCDIPFEDVPCGCGRQDHILLTYKKEL